ncbi:MAG TPA: GNAT family N-acetyltransferase [Rubrobacter sp.]|jgi:GNAT superfamily N-acetyltransferase|nr:GNAT family N-acetyltransferase [Rubrobacter sp.]HVD44650.1 GNAT family N-acetyltransferase [Rubrobacter sp.]
MDSKSKINARDATTEDAGGIHGLARELAETVGDEPPTEEAIRARLEELLDEPRARVLVAENEAGIVGGASFWIKPDLAHGDTVIEVPMLVVAEDHRRAGVGKLLMEEVRNVASDNGASQIELVATRANVTAREFYRSLGFVEADVVSLEFVGSQEDPPDPEE